MMLFQDDTFGAEFSIDRKYRYRLWRRWGPAMPACFCMLNPSTGDETELDPTLRRCIGFARSWGCGGIEVVNLFAFVSSDPKALLTHPDPVGDGNNPAIIDAIKRSGLVVFGWGAFPERSDRVLEVAELIDSIGIQPMCLGTTASGAPRHPLYLRKTAELFPWTA